MTWTERVFAVGLPTPLVGVLTLPQKDADSETALLLLNSGIALLTAGLTLFVMGLFKKVVLADQAAVFANAVFSAPADYTCLVAVAGVLGFAFQIYFDFSAYTDIAIGCGLMLGIRLPVNFRSPYRATSIADFWRRWHITLSRFLRDYLYIPLGGGRVAAPRRLANLMIVMLLGGLWHGAAWTFVLWGGLHGLFLALHRLWRGTGLALPRPVGWALTFTAVTAAWVPFRAADMDQAVRLWWAMIDLPGLVLPPSVAPLAAALGVDSGPLIAFNLPNTAAVLAELPCR